MLLLLLLLFVVVTCHQKREIPQVLTAAWIREVRRGSSRLRLPGLPPAEAVMRERSLIQGDPTAPVNFNLFLDDAIEIFTARCRQHDWGYPIAEAAVRDVGPQPKRPRTHRQRLPILVYADNYWLLATSFSMLQSMTKCWHKILTDKFECKTSYKDCRWITTAGDNLGFNLQIDGVAIPRAPRAQGIKVLGAQVSMDNCATAAINRCIANSWVAFRKHKDLLCNKQASPSRRLQLLDRFVRPAVSYCIGSLNPTRRHLQQLHAAHFKMARKILGIRRGPDTSLAMYLKDVADKINMLFRLSNQMWWSDYALKMMHSWAGHLGRMSIYDPQRFVFRALTYRNYGYLRALQEEHGHQCHGRRFRVWRWERNFYQFYGSDWTKETISNSEWAESFVEWSQWRSNVMGARVNVGNRSVKRFRISL